MSDVPYEDEGGYVAVREDVSGKREDILVVL